MATNALIWWARWVTGQTFEQLRTTEAFHYFCTRSRIRSYYRTVFGSPGS